MKKLFILLMLFLVVACNHNSCYDCNYSGEYNYSRREPVEVIYKRTYYRTIYEPKTYKKVEYEKVPVRANTCK